LAVPTGCLPKASRRRPCGGSVPAATATSLATGATLVKYVTNIANDLLQGNWTLIGSDNDCVTMLLNEAGIDTSSDIDAPTEGVRVFRLHAVTSARALA